MRQETLKHKLDGILAKNSRPKLEIIPYKSKNPTGGIHRVFYAGKVMKGDAIVSITVKSINNGNLFGIDIKRIKTIREMK